MVPQWRSSPNCWVFVVTEARCQAGARLYLEALRPRENPALVSVLGPRQGHLGLYSGASSASVRHWDIAAWSPGNTAITLCTNDTFPTLRPSSMVQCTPMNVPQQQISQFHQDNYKNRRHYKWQGTINMWRTHRIKVLVTMQYPIAVKTKSEIELP